MSETLASLRGGSRFHLRMILKNPGIMFTLLGTPFVTAVLLAVFTSSGRTDLLPYAVLAPSLMALLSLAIYEAGETISRDRTSGVLEAMLATPAALPTVLTGRILTTLSLGIIGVVEAWLMAALGFGIIITVPHPLYFAGALLVTVLGMIGASMLMAALFCTGKSVRTFQNSLSFPIMLLGGIMVPASMLPIPLSWLSKLFFLSWGSDLLRDSLTIGPVENYWGRLAITLILCLALQALASWVLQRLIIRLRHTGSVNYV